MSGENQNTESAFVDPPMPSAGAGEAASGYSSGGDVGSLGDALMVSVVKIGQTMAQVAEALDRTQKAQAELGAVAVGSNYLNGVPMASIAEAAQNFKDALEALEPVKERVLGYLASIGYSPGG